MRFEQVDGWGPNEQIYVKIEKKYSKMRDLDVKKWFSHISL